MADAPTDALLRASASTHGDVRAPSFAPARSYTEAETLAIIEAERDGKPHPYPEREKKRFEALRPPAPIEPEPEGQGAQLTFWADDKRAMPTQFIASALFSVVQPKDAGYLDGVLLASGQGLTINYKGKRLTQVHADVWQGIMHLSRRAPEETLIRFRARTFLRMIGRETGKSQRDQLHAWITDLQATSVEVLDETSKRLYFGSLLPEGGRDQSTPQDRAYLVKINRGLCKLFEAGFATINWDQRLRLRGKHNAQCMQHYFSWSKKPVHLAELHRLSGSAATLAQYKRNLREALADLEAEGGHAAFIDKYDVVRPKPTGSPAAKAVPDPSQTALPLPAGTPAISDAAKAEFRSLYPERDPERCVADFVAWLAKSGKTAKYPDRAFLGYARKWIAGQS
jgi:hypothetical protein